jgi:hypothetical protein
MDSHPIAYSIHSDHRLGQLTGHHCASALI